MSRRRAGRCLGAAWALVGVFAVDARAGQADETTTAAAPVEYEVSGRVTAAGRWFPRAAADSAQRALATGFVAEPRVYIAAPAGQSFTAAPFVRYDHADSRRTHLDLREAYLLLFGDIGDSGWELRLGVGQVFWGVTESQRLVDIVNQIDSVEHPNGEAKLGQPMAHATWFGDWGAVEVFAMPYHRARTFPGRAGRLRLPLLVDDERIEYTGGGGPWRLDVASRYSHSVGLFDLGLSVFAGATREPFLVPDLAAGGGPVLTQRYTQIRQVGVDAQATVGAWLWKLEAIHRTGALNLSAVEHAYLAAVLGGEYAFYAVGGSAIDLIVLGEWNYDGRGRQATPSRSPNTLDNDVFLATRLAFNDVQGAALTAGVFMDLGRATRTLVVEFDRRLADDWSIHAEVIGLLSVDPADLHYPLRTDSFVDVGLTYNF